MARIESADALIAIMTRREPLGEQGSGAWRTHPWVDDEIAHARAKAKLAIAMVESGVDVTGAHGEAERIPLQPDDPVDALLALSETIRLWKSQLGVGRRVQLRPDEIGQELRTRPGMKCRYRFVSPQGARTSWRHADPVMQPSGTTVHLEGVLGDDQFIEIEILNGDLMEWYSPATAQLINVDLQPRNGSASRAD